MKTRSSLGTHSTGGGEHVSLPLGKRFGASARSGSDEAAGRSPSIARAGVLGCFVHLLRERETDLHGINGGHRLDNGRDRALGGDGVGLGNFVCAHGVIVAEALARVERRALS